MSSINSNFNLKYHWLTNSYILEILANILMSYVSFKYIDTYTIKANIIVSAFLIGSSFFFFIHMRKNHIYLTSLTPFIFSRIKNLSMVIVTFFLLCLKSFLLIRYSSMLNITISMINGSQVFIEHSTFTVKEFPSLRYLYSKAIIIGMFIVAIFFIQYRFYYKKFKENEDIKKKVYSLIEKFNLDKKKTKFFVDGTVEAFKVKEYLYFLNLGLLINGRIYNKNTVMDYFDITGIGFENLNNDHITNIQMYSV